MPTATGHYWWRWFTLKPPTPTPSACQTKALQVSSTPILTCTATPTATRHYWWRWLWRNGGTWERQILTASESAGGLETATTSGLQTVSSCITCIPSSLHQDETQRGALHGYSTCPSCVHLHTAPTTSFQEAHNTKWAILTRKLCARTQSTCTVWVYRPIVYIVLTIHGHFVFLQSICRNELESHT